MVKKHFIIFVLIITFLLGVLSGCSPTSVPPVPPSPSSAPPAAPGNAEPNPDDNPSSSASKQPLDTFMRKFGEATREATRYHDVSAVTVLVNKQNALPADYIPSDLVDVDIPFIFSEKVDKRKLRQEAALHLADLFTAAKKENIILYGVSGYRSYQTQKGLFISFTQRYGSEEKANQISARPGESEHQTGLAMDVTSQSVNFGLEERFGNTKEFTWLKDNAHLYGYIIRYPKGKEYLTEYTYEPWHLRYIGQELATTLYQEGITYEEYLFFRI